MPARFEPPQPTVMWRMRRPDGRLSHAVIGTDANRAIVAWFVNNRSLGYREFENWTGALQWCEQMQAQNWAAGWRLFTEDDDRP